MCWQEMDLFKVYATCLVILDDFFELEVIEYLGLHNFTNNFDFDVLEVEV